MKTHWKSEGRNPKAEIPQSGTNSDGRLQKMRPANIRTVCSPSPLPSPSGRGSIARTSDNPSRLELSQDGHWFSLSLRERAGVRGNGPWKAQATGAFQLAPETRIRGVTLHSSGSTLHAPGS